MNLPKKAKNAYLIVTSWDNSLSEDMNNLRMLKLMRIAEDKGYQVEIVNYITESQIKEAYILQDTRKTDNELRFDGIEFNNMFKPKQDCCFVKYSDDEQIRMLKYNGFEKAAGKFSWGAGDNFSFLKENKLFTFAI
jgi:hypothetical protein